ncbi:MAG: polyprenyl synthetase family protein [Pirellulaceae bacterium]|nr:polyprenyl synthetase family protein [Pirellulaceae bacterium]
MPVALAAPDFAELTRRLRREVDAALEEYATYGDDCPPHLAEAIRHSLLAPCKRLRPLLVLMSCQACGYDHRNALPAACAVEMIHTYSLIHDDLPAMDDDDLRRGRPSCHAQFGEATAILAGDALLAQAFEVLATGLPASIAARCCGELAVAAGACNLVGGQEDDLQGEFSGLGYEQLERIHRRKTGAIIRVSLRLGALVAGADDEKLAALDTYGENLGLAFQIVDDLLDLSGNEASLGKRTGKDSGHGKLTFPAVLGEAESRRRAGELAAAASDSLAPFGSPAAGLEALARYVVERDH